MTDEPDAPFDHSAIPNEVADDEGLHRRIHPTFLRPDGSVSSQAFRDERMSVDRAKFRPVRDTLEGYDGYGLARLLTVVARRFQQEVAADKQLLNPAHALVKGQKTKGIARKLARKAFWIVPLSATAAAPN